MSAKKVETAAPDIRALRLQIDAWRDHKCPGDHVRVVSVR